MEYNNTKGGTFLYFQVSLYLEENLPACAGSTGGKNISHRFLCRNEGDNEFETT